MDSLEQTRQYDVAFSYAVEDQQYVEAVAIALKKMGRLVFNYKFEEAKLAGNNLVELITNIYYKEAHLCIIFISDAYLKSPYTQLELQAAQARALESDEPYIIPVRLDETKVPSLLPTVVYVSGKTPEGLAELISSKLLLNEPPGFKLSTTPPMAEALLIRFESVIQPYMETFRHTIKRFEHWAEEKLWSVPVELRIFQPLQRLIDDSKDFRLTDSWASEGISEEARQGFSKIYDERVPLFLSNTIKGVQILVHHYWFARESRLEQVVRKFLMTRMTMLCRLLFGYRLIGMQSSELESMFPNFAYVYSEGVMTGLPYACFLDQDERFLWVDVEGRDTSTAIIWPQNHFRLYAPSELLLSIRQSGILTADQFDRFFATQFLHSELEKMPGQPLYYFAQYPDRLRLSVRGEWAIDTQHFEQHSTSNFGGKPLFETVRRLRAHVLSDADRKGLSDFAREIAIEQIRSLFADGAKFDEILFPAKA